MDRHGRAGRASLTPRPVAGTVEELVGQGAIRSPMSPADSKSGARFERVRRGGERFVLKHVDRDHDWIMRQTGDLGCVPVTVWESGVLDLVPECIDHTTVGAARTPRGGAVLMRDVGAHLVASDGSRLALDQHLRFLGHLAACHAACLGWRDTVGLVPLANRYSFFGPAALACEEALGFPQRVARLARDGWVRLAAVAPDLAAALAPLRSAPYPVLEAMATTPWTFLHGDWKLANLGSHPDGRTILVDWSMCGAGPPLTELAHYVALNGMRLPAGHSRDDAIAVYRDALEGHGVDTEPWWDRQLALCTVGVMLQLGWQQGADESGRDLAWWRPRALAAIAGLGR